jgi:hypothetical protein
MCSGLRCALARECNGADVALVGYDQHRSSGLPHEQSRACDRGGRALAT